METNCLIVDAQMLRRAFGERFWNDVEGIICVPTKRISASEWSTLWIDGVNTEVARKVQYLIAEE